MQAERDALFDRLARQQAEFENLKKRAAREQAEFREYAVADTVKQLIPILDNFDLALKSQAASDGDLRKGVELIRKQMDEVLTKLGVQAIAAKGQPFDPRDGSKPLVVGCSGAAFQLDPNLLEHDIGPRLLALVGNLRSALHAE